MGRLLGLDYGERRVGIAVTDECQILSSPFAVYQNDASFLEKLKALHADYHFEAVIVGFPYSETHTEASEKAKRFGEKVSKALGLPLHFQNEEFSTVYAATFLKTMGSKKEKQKFEIDKYAAQKILSDYLESNPLKR